MNVDIPGRKKWVAKLDERTSKECRELNNKTIPLDSAFELENGDKFVIPPQHPNCRCRIVFVPD